MRFAMPRLPSIKLPRYFLKPSPKMAAAVIEPTAHQLAMMDSLADVASWAKLSGPIDHPGSMAGSLFKLMGVLPDLSESGDGWQDLCTFANIDPEDFNAELQTWQYADMQDSEQADGMNVDPEGYTPRLSVRPKPADKGYARAAFNAARIRAKIIPSRADKKTESDYKLLLEETAVTTAKDVAASNAADKVTAMKDKVKLAEVVDVTLGAEIPLMPDSEFEIMWNRFRKIILRPPDEDEAPSQQQLTALSHLLLVMSCYVDFAQWCAHHFRNLKAFKCAGVVPGPRDSNGLQTYIQQEYKGPPDYSFWWAAWRVFQAAMIMAGACTPTYLKRYAKMIRNYNAQFTDAAGTNPLWAFLYQCDNRYRREHLPRMLRAANLRLNRLMLRSPNGEAKLYHELIDGSGEEVRRQITLGIFICP